MRRKCPKYSLQRALLTPSPAWGGTMACGFRASPLRRQVAALSQQPYLLYGYPGSLYTEGMFILKVADCYDCHGLRTYPVILCWLLQTTTTWNILTKRWRISGISARDFDELEIFPFSTSDHFGSKRQIMRFSSTLYIGHCCSCSCFHIRI